MGNRERNERREKFTYSPQRTKESHWQIWRVALGDNGDRNYCCGATRNNTRKPDTNRQGQHFDGGRMPSDGLKRLLHCIGMQNVACVCRRSAAVVNCVLFPRDESRGYHISSLCDCMQQRDVVERGLQPIPFVPNAVRVCFFPQLRCSDATKTQ